VECLHEWHSDLVLKGFQVVRFLLKEASQKHWVIA
jgi:hypothetical protein